MESVDLFAAQEKSSQRFSERFYFFLKGVPGFEERITEDDWNDLGDKDFYNLCSSRSSLCRYACGRERWEQVVENAKICL